jgi:hypothetical protein
MVAAIAVAIDGTRLPNSAEMAAETIFALGKTTGLTPWLLRLASNRSCELDALCQSYHTLREIAVAAQVKSAVEVMRGLRDSTLKSALMKGVVYSTTTEDGGLFNDIDLTIPADQIADGKKLISTMGYSQNVVSHNGSIQLVPDEAIQKFESAHYELFPFTRIIRLEEADRFVPLLELLGITHPFVIEEKRAYLSIELDVHHNLSHGIDSNDYEQHVSWLDFDGEQISCLDWTTHVWFVAARIYHETMILNSSKLRPIVELGRMIRKYEIEWSRVLLISKKYALSPSLYYPLAWLSDSFNVSIPLDVLGDLDEDRKKSGLHDFGDFVPKILGESIVFRPQL